MMENVLAAAQASGAILVYADNCYMYAPTSRPMTESMPYTPATKKGRIRKELAERALAAHQQGTARVTIGRATAFYGPHVTVSTMGDRFFPALIAGKGVNWFGPLDLPHAMTFVDDFATGMLMLGTHENALGQAWHIPAAEPLTGRQYIDLASELAGVPARPAVAPKPLLQALGLFNPTVREFVEMLYEYKEPYLIDGSKYHAVFGGSPTPHRDALQQTVAWYKQPAISQVLAAR
jgi:nucleoside-diphosphate-sugar epimerase